MGVEGENRTGPNRLVQESNRLVQESNRLEQARARTEQVVGVMVENRSGSIRLV